MRVIVDSNVICRDFLLRSTSFRVLVSGIATAGHSLHVPQVVIDEVHNSFAEQLRRCRNKIDAILQDVQRITGNALASPLAEEWVHSAVSQYRKDLSRGLREANAEIMDYPRISHQEMVARALSRRKPFGTSDAGYRDALIWANVLDLAQADGEAVALVTENVRDFGDDQGHLHHDLVTDLEAQGIAAQRVKLVSGLNALVEEFVKPSMEALEEIRDQLSAGEYPLLDLWEELPAHIMDAYRGVEWDPVDLGFPQEYENPTIDWLEGISNMDVTEVRKLAKGDLLIEVEADANCTFDFFIFKADYYAMSDDPAVTVWDRDWSDHYVLASAGKRVHIVARLTFSPESSSVTSLEIDQLSSEDEGGMWQAEAYRKGIRQS